MNRIKQTLNPFYLLLFLTVCICFSCKDDEDANSRRISFQEGDTLMLDEEAIQEVFPLEDYQNNSAIVYRNTQGQEHRFPIVLTEENIECPNHNLCVISEEIGYSANVVNIKLAAEGFPNNEVNFCLSPDVNLDNFTFDYCVSMGILEYDRVIIANPNPFPTFMFKQVVACLDTYEPSDMDVAFVGAVFEDVVTVGASVSNDGIQKAYFTTELGLAAFEDEFNDIFVFDRFE